jgi:hypothetical protein
MRRLLPLFFVACLVAAALGLPHACFSAPPVLADKQVGEDFEPDDGYDSPVIPPFGRFGAYAPNPYDIPREFRAPLGILSAMGVVAVVAVGFLLLVGATVKQPAEVSVVPINNSKPSPYLIQATEELATLGFQPLLDFKIPEFPHTGKFRLTATTDGTRGALIFEIETKGPIKQYFNFVEFKTVTDNGLKITSNNSSHKNSLKPLPGLFMFMHPEIPNITDLYNQHRADVDTVRSRQGGRIVSQDWEHFQERFPEEWREMMKFQRAEGLMKKGGDKNVMKGTMAMVIRYFTPEFKDSKSRFAAIAVVILGALLILGGALAMPKIASGAALSKAPFLAAKIEAALIVSVCLIAGYFAAPTGGAVGPMCFVPSVVLLISGPIGIFLPICLALESAFLGGKLRNAPPPGVSLFKHLSPHWYIMLLLFLVAGMDLGGGY